MLKRTCFILFALACLATGCEDKKDEKVDIEEIVLSEESER